MLAEASTGVCFILTILSVTEIDGEYRRRFGSSNIMSRQESEPVVIPQPIVFKRQAPVIDTGQPFDNLHEPSFVARPACSVSPPPIAVNQNEKVNVNQTSVWREGKFFVRRGLRCQFLPSFLNADWLEQVRAPKSASSQGSLAVFMACL